MPMQTKHDLSDDNAEELRAVIADANDRLDVIRQALIDQAASHGLKLVNGKKPSKRRGSKHDEA